MTKRPWFRKTQEDPARESRVNTAQVPTDVAAKCPNRECGQILLQKELEKDFKVCKKCGYHFRLTAQERVAQLLDESSFTPFEFDLRTDDPLNFPGYRDKLARHQQRTGMIEAVLAGRGSILGHAVAISITDYHFMAGTMNSVVGETISRTLEEAFAAGLPVVLVSGSGGGARMEESILSLMQMAKTSAAMARFHGAGLLSICLLTDSTMAGIFASWASLGDVILAEPGAVIGFTGERVAAKVQTEREPDNFRSAEFNFEHGMIDRVTPRSQLRETIGKLLSVNSLRGGVPG
jgi:acetyl-CoA carboxylase carboxyl transferase subunit beta